MSSVCTSCIWWLLHLKFSIILKWNVCSTLQICTFYWLNSTCYWAAVMHPYGQNTNLWPHLRTTMVECCNSSWQLFGWHDMARICGIGSYPVVLGLSWHTHPEVIAISRTGHCHYSFSYVIHLGNALGLQHLAGCYCIVQKKGLAHNPL